MPEFSSYNYVFNNPITFVDPDGMSPIDFDFEKSETKNQSIRPVENHYFSSTFVKPDGTVLEHRDDGDFRIYLVSDEQSWINGGRSKEGLSWVGLENPSHTYTPGDRISLFNYDHNVLAKPSGQIDQNYDIESYLFPGIGLYKLYKWYRFYKAYKSLKGLTKTPSKKSGGTKYVDPKNPHNNIREMPGNPNSPYPEQQKPYVIYKKNGVAYDVNGNPLQNARDPAAHIPRDKFDINKMPKFD